MTGPSKDAPSREIAIGSIHVDMGRAEDSGDGWRYDREANTLTLAGVGSRDSPAPPISILGDLTILLADGSENYVTALSRSGESDAALEADGHLTIRGGGKLFLESLIKNGVGLRVWGKLEILERAEVSATGHHKGVMCHLNLWVHEKAKLTAQGREGCGIYVRRKAMFDGEAFVEAAAHGPGNAAIHAELAINMIGGVKISGTGDGPLLWAEYDLVLRGAAELAARSGQPAAAAGFIFVDTAELRITESGDPVFLLLPPHPPETEPELSLPESESRLIVGSRLFHVLSLSRAELDAALKLARKNCVGD